MSARRILVARGFAFAAGEGVADRDYRFDVGFHDLRHTAATLGATSGSSLKALMARSGHADRIDIDSDQPEAFDQDFFGGDDGTRTHDFLLAKQVL